MMPVSVWFARWVGWAVGVSVMFVVEVQVSMLHRFMPVFVLVALG